MRSQLGQPLHATIKITGANTALDTDCFSLLPSTGAAAPPPLRPQLSLERGGSDMVLHIRTPLAMSDPISQFTLASDCETKLQREYVILLDPPSQAARSHSQSVPTTTPLTIRSSNDTPAAASANPPASKNNGAATRAAQTSESSPRRQRSVGKKQPQPTEAAPRLVLSGRHGLSSEALSLRFDTNLPDLTRPRPEQLTADEVSDENTALTRKLAHLESQMVALNQRNAELEAKRTALAGQGLPKISGPAQWPLYLLISALLIIAVGLIVWLRRRSHTVFTWRKTEPSANTPSIGSLDKMADPWTQPPGKPIQSKTPTRPTKQAEPVIDPVIEFEPSSANHTTEVKDDTLDQAEVYMAHGHGELAVHLLQEHLRDAPDESPVPWLLLLDLLHREGDIPAYTIASQECRRYFNINLGEHPVSQETDTGQGLEAYPHILEQLLKVWGSPDVDQFFKELIFDDRGGTRIGFDPSAYREILLLRAVARDVDPIPE
ncbi:MAG TPA: hypothetical protein VIN38_13250 [Thiobacillus sp.]